MKKSILDYVIENGIWDSEDSSCPSAETFEEFDEETGRWWFDFTREEQAKIGKYGIFSDRWASDYGIDRFVTRDWIRTEAKEFYDDENDWEKEADKAGESGSIFEWIDGERRW